MRSTDEVYGSLAYDGAPLLRVPVCVYISLYWVMPKSKKKSYACRPTFRSISGYRNHYVYVLVCVEFLGICQLFLRATAAIAS